MSRALATRRAAQSIVDGEFPLTAENFSCIARLMKEESGVHLAAAKATLVYSRLAKRLRALRLDGFDAYCALVSSPEGEAERMAMFSALTTNVTRFFREPHHFEHLRDAVLKPLTADIRAGRKVRLWSSACSTGQEPYSIALTLLSVLPNAAQHDVRILATDIDPVVVETARAGVYSQEAVSQAPPGLRERWMDRRRQGDVVSWRVNDEARSLIVFKQLNLIGHWPMRGRFDAIFCRNVVIYFEEQTQNQVWTRFRNMLTPKGRLYIGHSERIDTPGYEGDGLTIYRLSGGSAR